jgi:hypothetical protein
VVAAGQVVKFIPKISVAVVEVAMQQQLRQGDGKNYDHAASEEGLVVRFRKRSRCRDAQGRKDSQRRKDESKQFGECMLATL